MHCVLASLVALVHVDPIGDEVLEYVSLSVLHRVVKRVLAIVVDGVKFAAKAL